MRALLHIAVFLGGAIIAAFVAEYFNRPTPVYSVGERVLVTWMWPAEPHYDSKIIEFSEDGQFVKVAGWFSSDSTNWESVSRLRKLKGNKIKVAMERE